MALAVHLGLALIHTQELRNKFFIGLVIHHQQEFSECLCQHHPQQQYDNQILQPCKIKPLGFKIIQKFMLLP
jgi:hypothetical protein